jgi:hypothetical protein
MNAHGEFACPDVEVVSFFTTALSCFDGATRKTRCASFSFPVWLELPSASLPLSALQDSSKLFKKRKL